MSSSWLRLKVWHYILIILGIPLALLLIIGIPALLFLGVESPIWAIISIAVSALTVISLVILNLMTIFMMKAQLEAQTTPSIMAYFDNPFSIAIYLVVKNIGNGAAKKVRLKVDPPLLDYQNRDINKLSLFKKGIEFFPPNREFNQLVGNAEHFFGKSAQRPLEYELTVSYHDSAGNPVDEQVIPLDLSVYRNLQTARESDIAKLTKEVAKLTQAITSKNI